MTNLTIPTEGNPLASFRLQRFHNTMAPETMDDKDVGNELAMESHMMTRFQSLQHALS